MIGWRRAITSLNCCRLLYALQVLRARGLPQHSLQDIFRATVEAKLIYAAPAWPGFCSAAYRVRLNTFLRRCTKLGAGASIPPTAMTQPFPSSPLPSFFFPSPPLPFHGDRGYDPRKNFGITDARRRVLEHFGHKSQHLYEPGFLTGSCKFRISSKCACGIVNRWSSVCDHLTEIHSFCWDIAAC